MKTYAYIMYEKTQACTALMELEASSESEAFKCLEKVRPAGDYATLVCAFVPDGEEAYAYWRDDSGALDDTGYFDGSSPCWYMRPAGHKKVMAEIAEAVGESSVVCIDNYVTCSAAAIMLGVSVSRVSQLADRGQLEVVTIGGRKMVTAESVEKRRSEAPKAGRPSKAKRPK